MIVLRQNSKIGIACSKGLLKGSSLTSGSSGSIASAFWNLVTASFASSISSALSTIAFSRRTLDLAYFNRDLRRSLPGAGEDEQKMTRRKDLGERLLRECPGDWRQEAIIFWDAPGPERSEFATREGAVEHVFWLLKEVAFHVLPDPPLKQFMDWQTTASPSKTSFRN